MLYAVYCVLYTVCCVLCAVCCVLTNPQLPTPPQTLRDELLNSGFAYDMLMLNLTMEEHGDGALALKGLQANYPIQVGDGGGGEGVGVLGEDCLGS